MARRRAVTVLMAGALVASVATPSGGRVSLETPSGARVSSLETPSRARLSSLATRSATRPHWKKRIDRLVGRSHMGVSVRHSGEAIYGRHSRIRKPPASNQKLMLSMALFDSLGRSETIETAAAASRVRRGVVKGNLWIRGHGDPALSAGGRYGRALHVRPTYLGRLARKIEKAGIRRIEGHVIGSKGYFAHDWWAPGWRDHYRSLYIALPTALTLNGNTFRGRHLRDPEWRLARALTKRLKATGIRVERGPRARRPHAELETIASVSSAPLKRLVRHMNRVSSNFFAEVLGKRLGVARRGRPGTIAKGAGAVEAWARARGAHVTSFDSSGLSWANRASPRQLTRLIEKAQAEPWGPTLRRTLPNGGRGTLEGRLKGAGVRAKTGTLDGVSALSGWVWMRRVHGWGQFSILSRGLSKSAAVTIENKIVRTLAERAH